MGIARYLSGARNDKARTFIDLKEVRGDINRREFNF